MKKILLLAICLVAFKNSNAQANKANEVFNEKEYIDYAKSVGYTPDEVKYFVERSRNEFINGRPNVNSNFKTATSYSYNPTCTNVDFESGNVIGWAVSSGSNPIVNGSCNLSGCCAGSITNYTVMSNGLIDPVISFPINSVFGPSGGTKFIKMNDALPNLAIQKISQRFLVGGGNNLFMYSFLLVFDGTGHGCCDQPFYNFTLKDTLGNLITGPGMPNYSITVPGMSCPATPSLAMVTASLTGSSQFSYTPWMLSAIDLSAYIGNVVDISITVGDCTAGGHAAYMYFDAACAPLEYKLGPTPYPLNVMNNLPVGPTYTISAPANFNSYTWMGPTGTFTTPSLVTSTAGIYTLQLLGYGYGVPTQKLFNISTLGVSEVNPLINAISVYPNPAEKEFVIDNIPSKAVYSIYDVTGKIISDKTDCNSTKVKVNISSLEAGVYFIKLDTESGSKNFKIVKE